MFVREEGIVYSWTFENLPLIQDSHAQMFSLNDLETGNFIFCFRLATCIIEKRWKFKDSFLRNSYSCVFDRIIILYDTSPRAFLEPRTCLTACDRRLFLDPIASSDETKQLLGRTKPIICIEKKEKEKSDGPFSCTMSKTIIYCRTFFSVMDWKITLLLEG